MSRKTTPGSGTHHGVRDSASSDTAATRIVIGPSTRRHAGTPAGTPGRPAAGR